jgi:acyl-[acyl-carrier-protein]-phospholipid O-acyltransferase/long-chain-fatty-acid--[acyl-carrier-protein] ligase
MVALGRWLLRSVLRLAYAVRVTGLEHYEQAGRRVLIVANHTSFLDAALLAVFLPIASRSRSTPRYRSAGG